MIWESKLKIKHLIFRFIIKADFPFPTIKMPHLANSIGSKMFYSAFGVKILESAHTFSKYETFCKMPDNLIFRMSKQGGNINVSERASTEMYGRHFQTSLKFHNTSKEFFNSVNK